MLREEYLENQRLKYGGQLTRGGGGYKSSRRQKKRRRKPRVQETPGPSIVGFSKIEKRQRETMTSRKEIKEIVKL